VQNKLFWIWDMKSINKKILKLMEIAVLITLLVYPRETDEINLSMTMRR
jgi:hypothetical protein